MATPEKIGMEGLDNLGIDEFNHLYWKGEKIITEAMFDFPTWVDYALGFGAIAGGLAALVTVLRYLDIRPQWPWSRGSTQGGQT